MAWHWVTIARRRARHEMNDFLCSFLSFFLSFFSFDETKLCLFLGLFFWMNGGAAGFAFFPFAT